MGAQLRWLERTPDKREVGGSSPLVPIKAAKRAAEKNGRMNGKETCEKAQVDGPPLCPSEMETSLYWILKIE